LNNKNTDKDILKIESNKIKDNVKTGTEINIVLDFCDDFVYGKKHILNLQISKVFLVVTLAKMTIVKNVGGK
jgi:hypothetical protein